VTERTQKNANMNMGTQINADIKDKENRENLRKSASNVSAEICVPNKE